MASAAIVVILRLISRYLVLKNPGWDDYMIIVAMILGIIQTGLTLSCIPNGAAMHAWDIGPSVNVAYTLKSSYAVQILYPLVVTAIKSSILFLYLRLFPRGHFQSHNKHDDHLAANANNLAPSNAVEAKNLGVGYFLDRNHASETSLLAFTAGGMTYSRPCVSLIARIVLASRQRVSSQKVRADAAWFFAPAANGAIVEICFGLICASLIPLKPLVKTLVPSLVKMSQAMTSGLRKCRSQVSAQVLKAKSVTRLKHDLYAHMASSPPCAENSNDAVERGEGTTATRDVPVMENFPDLQHISEKATICARE
ncbi:hypothetical protein MMC07_004319 [Pseudocyphellaria aurata]|nr:hypothetical protein [Pseudocyphellaria aurata]